MSHLKHFKTDSKTSYRMSRIQTTNTSIEKRVRSVLHILGFRFRLKKEKLPGKPDIVLKRYKTVVFVHGCFWHGHPACRKGTLKPKRNNLYWEQKIRSNSERDKRVDRLLTEEGWRILTIWECETINRSNIEKIILNFFGIKNEKTEFSS